MFLGDRLELVSPASVESRYSFTMIDEPFDTPWKSIRDNRVSTQFAQDQERGEIV
jgi:hypothetical protein